MSQPITFYASTTLTTFMLQTQPHVRSVELLGSWDNFTKRYPMEKDLRRGRGVWRGCHSFENIYCEGLSRRPTRTRSGGLRMGGKYWYFYILDGDIDYHNPAEPSTTFCPLLPGQAVNVFDVPIDLGSEHPRDRSLSTADVHEAAPVAHTMNPADKFVNPRPAPSPAPRRVRLSSAPASLLRLFGKAAPAASFASLRSSPPLRPPNFSSGHSASDSLSWLLRSTPPRRVSPQAAPLPLEKTSTPGGYEPRSLDKAREACLIADVTTIDACRPPPQVAGIRPMPPEEPSPAPLTNANMTKSVQASHRMLQKAHPPRGSSRESTETTIPYHSVPKAPLNQCASSLASQIPTEANSGSRGETATVLESAPAVAPPGAELRAAPLATSHFSIYSTPSIRSLNSLASEDGDGSGHGGAEALSSPGLTNSDHSESGPSESGSPCILGNDVGDDDVFASPLGRVHHLPSEHLPLLKPEEWTLDEGQPPWMAAAASPTAAVAAPVAAAAASAAASFTTSAGAFGGYRLPTAQYASGATSAGKPLACAAGPPRAAMQSASVEGLRAADVAWTDASTDDIISFEDLAYLGEAIS